MNPPSPAGSAFVQAACDHSFTRADRAGDREVRALDCVGISTLSTTMPSSTQFPLCFRCTLPFFALFFQFVDPSHRLVHISSFAIERGADLIAAPPPPPPPSPSPSPCPPSCQGCAQARARPDLLVR
eukprot:CAMPEP_0195006562 /NCGR_PEP_ID=MMETSP0326_2-20130528/6824_1 /TAXON_ID=2866 ORGANISM="Crypthecodinium cohnii, Strain Seligo" /NCGR_SAMPLE_ID=MMETSP0326_2 /ASSEMBLY_ACC=CAM_ASM_000348 /LENGTH=126 /DNA_ID=CAMNT_0040013401 /DNA_START=102 /DNA_END=479 /DNA_ORIENTATION=+